ncbi:hypothetical protein SLA2020_179940 [Shorea laevis]
MFYTNAENVIENITIKELFKKKTSKQLAESLLNVYSNKPPKLQEAKECLITQNSSRVGCALSKASSYFIATAKQERYTLESEYSVSTAEFYLR